MTALAEEPGYMTWGPASVKLPRTMRLEAARAGHAGVMPGHMLVAVLEQPEVHQALRAIRQRPDIYAMRSRLAASSLSPAEFSDSAPLSSATETLLEGIRPHRPDEDFGLLYLLALKGTLTNQACRVLARQGGLDTDLLDTALAHLV